MKKILFAGVAGYISAHAAWAAEPITGKDWLNHPEILEVRAIFQKIEEEKKAGKLKASVRKFHTAFCPYADDVRILYTDQQGRPRGYYYEGGSEDSTLRSEMYYDDRGHLRFAFIRGGAYNGTQVEYRAYYSQAGAKIWEDDKLLEGPGYTFGGADGEAVDDPVAAFSALNACPESLDMGRTVTAPEFKQLAAQRFDKESRAGKIQGMAQIFGIVAACDAEKLKHTQEFLDDNEIAVQDYDFTLKVSRVLKSRTAIEGVELDDSVKRCIIDKYYQEVSLPSGSMMAPTVELKIRFPVVMAKGKKLQFPEPPAGPAARKK